MLRYYFWRVYILLFNNLFALSHFYSGEQHARKLVELVRQEHLQKQMEALKISQENASVESVPSIKTESAEDMNDEEVQNLQGGQIVEIASAGTIM